MRLLMEPITYANGSTLEDPGDHLRHLFSQLHVEGRFHVRRGHRSADRADAQEMLQERRRCAHSLRRRADPRAKRPGGRRAKSTAARSRPRSVVSNSNLRATIFNLVGEEHSTRICRRSPGRAAEQQQHAGLHGAQAGRDRSTKARAICSSAPPRRCFAPRAAAQPRHHQPHVFVLLSAHTARAAIVA